MVWILRVTEGYYFVFSIKHRFIGTGKRLDWGVLILSVFVRVLYTKEVAQVHNYDLSFRKS